MTEHTLKTALGTDLRRTGSLEICYTGADRAGMQGWLGEGRLYSSQGEGDLGQRMERAMSRAFAQGKRRVVLIGTDCPALSSAHLRQAFSLLRGADAVIGPALDGGYYLLGLRRMHAGIFTQMPWGGDQVFSRTRERLCRAGFSVRELPPLGDVDTPSDLDAWTRVRAQALSIVIPALNEEERIGRTLARCLETETRPELIVVDGGSRDRTAALAEEAGARVLFSRPGRGPQLNRGAGAAAGDILLFLHADTRVPSGYDRLIRSVLRDPSVVGGYFRLGFSRNSPLLRYKQGSIDLRTRVFRMPYGDQALFVRASVFSLAGGFPDIPIMEDVELVLRLRRLGKLAYVRESRVVTSARRFARLGTLRATLRNKITFYGYRLGFSPHRLARWYYRGTDQDPASVDTEV
jgi:rSAM/selenodomain-associated transferase 2/rSAM/selenodomain-associated transferase 1